MKGTEQGLRFRVPGLYQDIHDHIRETEQNPRRAKALERARQKLAEELFMSDVVQGGKFAVPGHL
jgi:hypothetical protein